MLPASYFIPSARGMAYSLRETAWGTLLKRDPVCIKHYTFYYQINFLMCSWLAIFN